jgi:hypothetical protein
MLILFCRARPRQVGYYPFYLCQRKEMGITHDRHHQPPIRTDRNANICVVEVHQFILVELAIDLGEFQQGLAQALVKKLMKPRPMPYFSWKRSL